VASGRLPSITGMQIGEMYQENGTEELHFALNKMVWQICRALVLSGIIFNTAIKVVKK
jgi:hypothetical protein